MKLSCLLMLFILLMVPNYMVPVDKIADFIRQGNSHELAKLFAPNVEMTILNDENTYAKAQAEIVVDKFFIQHKPMSVRLLHNVNSNASYRFNVLILTTVNGAFRIAYTLKETAGSFMIIELRIETEKVK